MIKNSPSSSRIAKLSLPRLSRGIIRPRLFAVLDEGRKGAATWIVAPGGAGKTTLAATYLAERKLPYLWYQLDKDDTDPATFFYYLGIAAQHTLPGQGVFLPLLTAEYLPDIPGFARRYFRQLFALLPPDTVLVLDNYQELSESSPFAEILRSAIGEIPIHGHLLIISRTDPPPELARHQTTGNLSLLEWDTLRLTLEETKAIAAHQQVMDDQLLQVVHQRAEGWPAAVTLLLEQIQRKGMESWDSGTGSLETIFQFFTTEYFNALPKDIQEFLLKTALLSNVTPTLAEKISGQSNAGIILSDLHRRHFFTSRRDLSEPHYQYHDLFREFLLAKGQEIYSREQYLNLIRRAGQLLTLYHRKEEAVNLYLLAKDWEQSIPLLLDQAPTLVAQGRSQIIAGWIQQIPDPLVSSIPWLLYWQGISQIAIQPFYAMEILRGSFTGFDTSNDSIGKILSASAIIDIIYFLRMSLLLAEPWLDIIQKELEINPDLPSSTIESRVITSLFTIVMYVRPKDGILPHYAKHLTALLANDTLDINQKVIIGAHLLHYYARISGNLQEGKQVSIAIRPLLTSPQLTPLNQYMWRALSIPFYIVSHRPDEALGNAQIMLDLVKNNSFSFCECLANVYVICTHFSLGEAVNAAVFLDRTEEMTNLLQRADLAWINIGKTMFSITDGNYLSALKTGQDALLLTSEVGAAMIVPDIYCLLTIASIESNNLEMADKYLHTLKEMNFDNVPRIHWEISLVEAYTYLKNNKLDNSHAALRRAFLTASQYKFYGSWICWNRRMMSRLCAEALHANIEISYALELIRKRKLTPPEGTQPENWPWPVKIHTLGGFRILVDEQVLTTSKAQQKPLLALQLIIALGGIDVRIDRLTELLWPDAEGDAAMSSFTTTISRLRKLIGDEAIHVKGGKISLNKQYCWVDIWELDRHLDKLDGMNFPQDDISKELNQILILYSGPFLADEEDEWALRLRKKLRSRLSRILSNSCIAMQEKGKAQQAERLVEKVRETDPEITLNIQIIPR